MKGSRRGFVKGSVGGGIVRISRAMTMSWFKPRFLIAGVLLGIVGTSFGGETILFSESWSQFVFLNPTHWKIDEVNGRESLILDQPSPQRSPVKRPGEFALLKRERPFENYSFSVEACSLEPSSKKGRDMCLLFGYQGDTRTRINLEKLPDPSLPDGWRTIRVLHSSNGEIKVWVDDLETPIMTAHDITYPVGKIGFGSFDDRTAFSRLIIE